jgi:hypothetical protein
MIDNFESTLKYKRTLSCGQWFPPLPVEPIFPQDGCPFPLGLENQFRHLPNSPEPSGSLSDIIHRFLNQGVAVPHADGQTDFFKQPKIHKIIAHKRNLFRIEFCFLNELFKNKYFISDPLKKKGNTQFFGPHFNGRGRTTGKKPHLDPFPQEPADSLSVLNVKVLYLPAFPVVTNPAVGQNSIHIQ